MDSMDATQRSYREADDASKQAPPAPLPGQPAKASLKKPPGTSSTDVKTDPPAPPTP
jgi:hypothetical protein